MNSGMYFISSYADFFHLMTVSLRTFFHETELSGLSLKEKKSKKDLLHYVLTRLQQVITFFLDYRCRRTTSQGWAWCPLVTMWLMHHSSREIVKERRGNGVTFDVVYSIHNLGYPPYSLLAGNWFLDEIIMVLRRLPQGPRMSPSSP